MHIEDSKLNIDVFLSEQQIQVVDQASGMTHEQMKIHLAEVGATNVDEEQRGFFGRGAKDAGALGPTTFTSIYIDETLSDITLDGMNWSSQYINTPITEKLKEKEGTKVYSTSFKKFMLFIIKN